jgi:putative transposase
MRLMGIEAIYPKPRLSIRDKEHYIYPYLLRDLTIDHPDQVWTADITYIRLRRGFAYLVAIMDWYSRYVLSWELSLTLETDFCVAALNRALNGKSPEIFNTDQGSQFTSEAFTGILTRHGIRISMDGKGRWMDNVFIERLWKSVKYEDLYLKAYNSIAEVRCGLSAYFEFYNQRRRHQGLDNRIPDEVYWSSRPTAQAAA